jgi:hypothetical protein
MPELDKGWTNSKPGHRRQSGGNTCHPERETVKSSHVIWYKWSSDQIIEIKPVNRLPVVGIVHC